LLNLKLKKKAAKEKPKKEYVVVEEGFDYPLEKKLATPPENRPFFFIKITRPTI